eukprot:14395920-Heterocapsa_arctica.AAC.1
MLLPRYTALSIIGMLCPSAYLTLCTEFVRSWLSFKLCWADSLCIFQIISSAASAELERMSASSAYSSLVASTFH